MLSKEDQIGVNMMSDKKSFDEVKTTEAAALLLQLGGGKMSYMKLLKLLYLADRKAFEEWERPITYDAIVSMKNGLVLSSTYDLLKHNLAGKFWNKHIKRRFVYSVQLKGKPPKIKALSQAEVELLHEIFEEYGHYQPFDLAEFTHDLPEYKDPGKSSIPVTVPELLEALEYDQEDIERISSELQEEANIAAIFGD